MEMGTHARCRVLISPPFPWGLCVFLIFVIDLAFPKLWGGGVLIRGGALDRQNTVCFTQMLYIFIECIKLTCRNNLIFNSLIVKLVRITLGCHGECATLPRIIPHPIFCVLSPFSKFFSYIWSIVHSGTYGPW